MRRCYRGIRCAPGTEPAVSRWNFLAKGISLKKSGSGRTAEQEVLKVEAEKRLDHGLTQL